jgi:hypothetical protein
VREPVVWRAGTESRIASPGSYIPQYLAEKILTSKSALEGERKQVTVLFADLKGSMELLADRDPDATRDALLTAGTELFAESGYDGVPVSAIAEKSRVNKAMINYHFGGKRQLYRAIVRTTFSEIVERVGQRCQC